MPYVVKLRDVAVAQGALARHRAAVASGETVPHLFRRDLGCGEGCRWCDLECAVMTACVETDRARLAEHGAPVGATVH